VVHTRRAYPENGHIAMLPTDDQLRPARGSGIPR
jgi:hypothetical protein